MSTLRDKVEQYVKNKIGGYKPLKVGAPKVIHDTILGSNLFQPYEIVILDLPLLQRLRRISQVDLASYVFPSGNHNRFEHTLGVAVISEKLVNSLFRKASVQEKFDKTEVLRHVRLAAIMHDCGHGPFSHMSEQVYEHFNDMKNEKEIEKFQGAKPHEILSYMIVTSQEFRNFFKRQIEDVYEVKINLDFVAEMIIGYKSNLEKAFYVDIINGAFDADKIDYIQRDSHFTGIKMVLDLDRLFHTLDIIEIDKKNTLCVDISGVSTLEQIVFNKMMLFSTVYHHHKVRAAECLFKSIFEQIETNELKIHECDFKSAADFLNLTDDDIYSLAKNKALGSVSNTMEDLSHRKLPKRALVLSNRTIEKINEKKIDGQILDTYKKMREYENKQESKLSELMLDHLMAISEKPKGISLLRKAISEATRNIVPYEEIFVDFPFAPKFGEATQWPVKTMGEKQGYLRLRDLFPANDWARAFSENKWQGYIFTKPENRKIVHDAAAKVLEEVYGIILNEYSWILCKVNEDE